MTTGREDTQKIHRTISAGPASLLKDNCWFLWPQQTHVCWQQAVMWVPCAVNADGSTWHFLTVQCGQHRRSLTPGTAVCQISCRDGDLVGLCSVCLLNPDGCVGEHQLGVLVGVFVLRCGLEPSHQGTAHSSHFVWEQWAGTR